jgi:hypothetical protein
MIRLDSRKAYVPIPFSWQGGWSKRLAKRIRAGQLVRITCQFCRITRYFEPADLEQVLGDVAFRQALGAMRCEKCRRRDYIVGALTIPTAEERAAIRLRRLVDVRYVRKVIWRDE